jgi:hypothetical protein
VDLILILRYVFIFVLRASGTAHEDLLHTFFLTVCGLASILLHGLNAILPGRWPVFYYICAGLDFGSNAPPKFASTQVFRGPFLTYPVGENFNPQG